MNKKFGSPTLVQSGRKIDSVFELFGFKEDDISQAIAWSLKSSPHFLALLVGYIGWPGEVSDVEINLQRHESVEGETGRTDIEIQSPGNFHIILEAKRGWNLPQLAQLEKYAGRDSFNESQGLYRRLVTVSECSVEYTLAHLPTYELKGVPIKHVSWKIITNLAKEAYVNTNGIFEKRLLQQLITYFRKIMRVQRIDSNIVYVVSVSSKTPDGWEVSWIDIIEKHDRYFHPMSKNWPKEPPAYIGFRYRGRLQSIHFIEKYEVIDNLNVVCPGIPDEPRKTSHYLYNLGPAIRPPKTVKNGDVFWNVRVKAAIDTLLTCDTISEARDITKQRLEGAT